MKQRDIGFIQGMACAINLCEGLEGLQLSERLYKDSNIPLEEFEKYADPGDYDVVKKAAEY